MTSGAGKSKASAQMAARLLFEPIAGEKGLRAIATRNPRAERRGPSCRQSGRGNRFRHVKAAVRRGAAAERLARSNPPSRAARADEFHARRSACTATRSTVTPGESTGRAIGAGCDVAVDERPGHRRLDRVRIGLERPGKDGRAGAGEGAAERARGERRRLHRRQCGQQMLALRLDQQILEPGAEQVRDRRSRSPRRRRRARRLCSTASFIGTSGRSSRRAPCASRS